MGDLNAPLPDPPSRPRQRDEDALVAVHDVGWLEAPVVAGQRAAADHPAVKHDRRAFVEVVPPGLSREDALVALATMRMQLQDGSERVLHAGQWAHRDDPFVALHPHQFVPPEPQS